MRRLLITMLPGLILFPLFVNAQYAPATIGPKGTTSVRFPVFTWHTFSSATSYTIQVDTAQSFINPIVERGVTDTFYTSEKLLPLGTIYWRVKANNSTFSSTENFIITDGRIPVTLKGYPYSVGSYAVSLRWYRPLRPVSLYGIKISKDYRLINAVYIDTTRDTFFVVPSGMEPGKNYWRVKGEDSPYSNLDSFFIYNSFMPVPSRHNGDTIRSDTVPLQWSTVSGANQNKVQIWPAKYFTGVRLFNVKDTFLSFLPATSGKYLWRLSCDIDTALYSDIDSFVVIKPSFLIPRNPPISANFGRYDISVYQLNGKQVKTINDVFFSGSQKISVKDIAQTGINTKGIYLLQFIDRNQKKVCRVPPHLLFR